MSRRRRVRLGEATRILPYNETIVRGPAASVSKALRALSRRTDIRMVFRIGLGAELEWIALCRA